MLCHQLFLSEPIFTTPPSTVSSGSPSTHISKHDFCLKKAAYKATPHNQVIFSIYIFVHYEKCKSSQLAWISATITRQFGCVVKNCGAVCGFTRIYLLTNFKIFACHIIRVFVELRRFGILASRHIALYKRPKRITE